MARSRIICESVFYDKELGIAKGFVFKRSLFITRGKRDIEISEDHLTNLKNMVNLPKANFLPGLYRKKAINNLK
jgi:hypothetical protein